jgi:glycosyltransferase involved in cell wall biosynthesis
MRHLIVSREYPPAPYAAGGIGAYVANIARLMAEAGETVHIVAQRWKGAPLAREESIDGRLIVHRVGEGDLPGDGEEAERLRLELAGLRASDFPNQWFAWSAGLLAERLVAAEGVDAIEGQEWEAPLHFLMLRRALGLGPERRPPCIVHLHSATAFIRRFNGSMVAPASHETMTRMEAFCIHQADALLCPSRFYAAQCEQYFSLPAGSVRVIPLPIGEVRPIARTPETWASGPVVVVGRIEPRKGVVEWMSAAAHVAREDPDIRFDFVGADILGMQAALAARLPSKMRSRFRFHGAKTRAEMDAILATARAAAVPSRWENFPNVCVEAMGSGLPVIATRTGGMAEMIEDGRCGWLAPDPRFASMEEGLVQALRRCLAASPSERASMGAAAHEAVARLCDNHATVAAHLEFRSGVVARGAARSARFGAADARTGRPARSGRCGVVVRASSAAAAASTLASLHAQTEPPAAVALVLPAREAAPEGAPLVEIAEGYGSDAWNRGYAALSGREIGFWMFLDAEDSLAPACLARVRSVFDACPDIGLLSPWTERPGGAEAMEARPCPHPVHQLVRNDAACASAFRHAALAEGPPFQFALRREYDIWRLANAVMARGWRAATLPELLARRSAPAPELDWPEATTLHAMRTEALSPLRAVVGDAAADLVERLVHPPGASAAARVLSLTPRPPLPQRLARLVLDPKRTIRITRRMALRFWRGVHGHGDV